MKAIDFIVEYIEEHNMTQAEAAAKAGMSRQNFWDKLNKANPRFESLEQILTGFGYEIRIVRSDGREPGFDVGKFLDVCRKDAVSCRAFEDLVEAMDYRLEIVEAG